MIDLAERVDAVEVLAPGDLLVLCTDGVTEARSGDEFLGEARLRAAIEYCDGSGPQAVADGIVDVALAFQDGTARDDMAVLVLAPVLA
jgi:sigma-B regulation protein RsbU (phosphoserine phosphatase)